MSISLPAFLDIIIGLVFIYIIISLLASEIQELFAGFWQWRAKHLKKSIYLMLSGEKIEKRFWGQATLTNKLKKKAIEGVAKKNQNTKSNLPILLIDKIYKHYEIASLEQSSLGFLSGSENQYGASYIPPESFAEAFTDVILENFPEKSVNEKFIENLISGTNYENLNYDHIKKNLSRIANKTNVKVTDKKNNQQLRSQFVKEVATWFQRAQDRTTGTYKRNSKIFMFLIGFAAAVFANANTFTIIDNLHDEDIREAVVTQALSSVGACQNQTDDKLQECLKPKVEEALKINELPIGRQFGNDTAETNNTPDNENVRDNVVSEAVKCFKANKDKTDDKMRECLNPKLEEALKVNETPAKDLPKNNSDSINYIGTKIIDFIGYLVTAIAVMMGAPFWFDLLKKFVNVRNAGVKPKPVETKPSKTE